MTLARRAQVFTESSGQVVQFSLNGSHLPPLVKTVRVAEAFRSAVLAAFQVVSGNRESFVLSGHEANGKPDHGHRHGFYLPVPDEDGKIVSVYVVSPVERFSMAEMEALKLIRVLQWNRPSTRTRVDLISDDDSTLNQVAATWSTITPYVPPRRFYGTPGKHHLTPEKQLVAELTQVTPGIYQVEELRKVSDWLVDTRVPNQPNGVRQRLNARRQGFYVRFRATAPLCGPVLLGHSTHFGLGQFRPNVSRPCDSPT